MPSCSAIDCVNRSNSSSLSFYQLPSQHKRPELRKKWLLNIRRDGILPKDRSFFICSEHFEKDCFERDLKVS